MGTFLVKWAAASLVTGENKFLPAFSSAGERINGTLPGGQADGLARVPMAVAANLTMMFGGETRVEPVRVAAGMAASFLVLGSVLYLYYNKKKGNGTGVRLLLLLGSVALLRYMVLNNHSYLHEFFTYRALISPVLAIFLSVALSVELPLFRRKRRRKRGKTGGGRTGKG